MASLYFANQRAQRQQQQHQEDELSNTNEYVHQPSTASSAIDMLPMSVVGRDDGIVDDDDTANENGNFILQNGGSVASDLTQETGHASAASAAAAAAATHPPHAGSIPSVEFTNAEVMNAEVTHATEPTSPGIQDPKSSIREEYMEKEKDEPSANKRCWLVASCVLLVVLGGGVGAGMGIALSRNKEDSEPSPLLAPTGAPTVLKVPVKPQPLPTDKTDPPSDATSAPDDPTVSPTSTPPIDTPLNDQCVEANALESEAVTFGTTFGATYDLLLVDQDCDIAINDGPGVWYQVSGQGAPITASTCGDTNFDTKLTIFAGNTCEAGNLMCVTSNDDAPMDICGTLSHVTWRAEVGVIYYIWVRGFENAVGDFQLALTSGPVENDFCDGAIPVQANATFVIGSTGAATDDIMEECGGLQSEWPGIWYKLVGTGATVVASTCHQTELDTIISVFSGNCGELVCIVSNDDACATSSRVSFQTDVGTNYFILIHGFDSTGQFNLFVSEPDEYYNDFCPDARPATLGDFTLGDNLRARPDFGSDGAACHENITLSGPTVWYSVIGTGGELLVSLCSVDTTFDTQMSVFKGGCTSLVCVDGNDDSQLDISCGLTSQVRWNSEAFQVYHVAVHGFANATGNFGFSSEVISAPAVFDTCEAAGGPIPLDYTVPVFLADLADTPVFDPIALNCGGDSLASTQGGWVYIVADGGNITVSLCDTSPPGTQVFVYEGSCENLFCIEPDPGACSVTFQSVANQYYLIFIQGVGRRDYELEITSSGPPPPPVNDICISAIPIPIEGDRNNIVFGSTIGATLDTAADQVCGETITSPGVWYTVVGLGSTIRVSLCTGTDFDTRITVFRGNCDTLECVGENDDFCEIQSAFGFVAEAGITYYVLVHGFQQFTGNFEITATPLQ